jgi:hypothetical protein
MMTKAQRKRRAVVAALALLEWRDRMAEEEARNRMIRANAERDVTARYEIFIAEMRTQAEAPRVASRQPCMLITASVSGNGAAGAVS